MDYFSSLTIKEANDNWFSSRYLYNRYLKAGEINFASPEEKFENLVASGQVCMGRKCRIPS